MENYRDKLAVLYQQGDFAIHQQLATQLEIALYETITAETIETFFLSYREGSLKLLDKTLLKKGGLQVEIEPRPGEQRSYPAAKEGALVQAIGRQSQTVVDTTTGWGQDSLCLFRMGYQVLCIERSPLMVALLRDGFSRLQQLPWVQNLQLETPQLLAGNAIELLQTLTTPPDCIYVDPMFPPKRKKSALAKKSMQILHDLIGQDTDKEELFVAALQATGKRVVVKNPDYAEPFAKPSASFSGKLVRYDVYLKN